MRFLPKNAIPVWSRNWEPFKFEVCVSSIPLHFKDMSFTAFEVNGRLFEFTRLLFFISSKAKIVRGESVSIIVLNLKLFIRPSVGARDWTFTLNQLTLNNFVLIARTGFEFCRAVRINNSTMSLLDMLNFSSFHHQEWRFSLFNLYFELLSGPVFSTQLMYSKHLASQNDGGRT